MFFASSTRDTGAAGVWLLLCSLLAWGLAAAGMQPARGQVPLELHRRVDAPGEQAFRGRLLPPNTTAVVLPYSAEQPHTLENAGIPREDLARLVLERLRVRDEPVRVTDQWQTDRSFPRTSDSGELLYVLARTPADSLYETYVFTGEGFVPGFDAVETGRMTMGRVPPEAARRYRATFRVYREETGAGVTAETESEARGEAPASGGADTTAPASSEREGPAETGAQSGAASTGSSPVGGPWTFLLGALLGGVLGGGLTWYLSAGRIEEVEMERNRLQRQINRQKDAEFREATGASPSGAENDGTGDSSGADADRLREENEKLKEENQSLRDEIHEIRRYVENLREKRS